MIKLVALVVAGKRMRPRWQSSTRTHRAPGADEGVEGPTYCHRRSPRAAQGRPQTPGSKGMWTAAQAAEFLAHHANHRLYAAWALAIVVGLRGGELLGLEWDRIDLDGAPWRCIGSAPPFPATVPSRRRPRTRAGARRHRAHCRDRPPQPPAPPRRGEYRRRG